MNRETRKGQTYFYRKHRRGGRVISEYVGGGPFYELMAECEAARRAQRQEEREIEAKQMAWMDEADRQADAVFDQVDELMSAVLLASGFHRHRGQWRKKRDEEKGADQN